MNEYMIALLSAIVVVNAVVGGLIWYLTSGNRRDTITSMVMDD